MPPSRKQPSCVSLTLHPSPAQDSFRSFRLHLVLEVTRDLLVAVRWWCLEGEARSVHLCIYLSGQVGYGLGLAQGTEQDRVC